MPSNLGKCRKSRSQPKSGNPLQMSRQVWVIFFDLSQDIWDSAVPSCNYSSSRLVTVHTVSNFIHENSPTLLQEVIQHQRVAEQRGFVFVFSLLMEHLCVPARLLEGLLRRLSRWKVKRKSPWAHLSENIRWRKGIYYSQQSISYPFTMVKGRYKTEKSGGGSANNGNDTWCDSHSLAHGFLQAEVTKSSN